MNLRKSLPGKGRGPGVEADILRIGALWQDCRQRFGTQDSAGPFLFGSASAADAMYAPVATRFRTYGVALDPVAADYVETVFAWPAFREWQAAALEEPWIIAGGRGRVRRCLAATGRLRPVPPIPLDGSRRHARRGRS